MELRFIYRIQKEPPLLAPTLLPLLELPCCLWIKGSVEAIVGKVLDADEEPRLALSEQRRCTVPELLCLPARGLSEQHHATVRE